MDQFLLKTADPYLRQGALATTDAKGDRVKISFEVGGDFVFTHVRPPYANISPAQVEEKVDHVIANGESLRGVMDDYRRVENFSQAVKETLAPLREEVREATSRTSELDTLTQFLGVSLRGVLPFAIESVAQRRYQAEVNEDPDAMVSAVKAHQLIDRAEAALVALRETDLNIDDKSDDELDGEFTIFFED